MITCRDTVKLSDLALENYGEKYRGKIFKVHQWYDHYVSPDRMSGDPHGHPGFDRSSGMKLYHLTGFPSDLYEWELVKI